VALAGASGRANELPENLHKRERESANLTFTGALTREEPGTGAFSRKEEEGGSEGEYPEKNKKHGRGKPARRTHRKLHFDRKGYQPDGGSEESLKEKKTGKKQEDERESAPETRQG